MAQSEKVIQAVAEAEGVEPLELDPPLYDAINPDALDTLFRSSTGTLTFSYHGYTVTIDNEGTVRVEE